MLVLNNRLAAPPAAFAAGGCLSSRTFGFFGAANVDADVCFVGGDAGILDWLAAAPAVLKRMLIELLVWALVSG